jgi:uncharacterized membrane protein
LEVLGLRLRPSALAVLFAAFVAPTLAHAEFRVCNQTKHMIGLAVARSNGIDWISEGWWNIDAEGCTVILEGPLKARYYYLYAVQYDIGGGWSGDRYFCTTRRSFTITGRQDCQKRGFDRTGFFEVDTQDALDYTHILTDTP